MHGPPLSPMEVAAVLHRAVTRFEALGIGREVAVRAVAIDRGLSPAQVAAAIARVAPLVESEAVV